MANKPQDDSDAEFSAVRSAVMGARGWLAARGLTNVEVAGKIARAAIAASKTARREEGVIEITVSDYKRLLAAAECDDMIVWCETCKAWLDRDDPATCTADDFTGCWKVATHRAQEAHLCRSYRVID